MSNQASNPAAPSIFNRALYARRRGRAKINVADFLHGRAADDIIDRLQSTTRRFDRALIYGAGDKAEFIKARGEIGTYIAGDLAPARTVGAEGVVFDSDLSPFKEGSFDLVVDLLTLHTANDPIGVLTQYRRALKPDGMFLAVVFAEDTLKELRGAFVEAESALANSVSPRVAPFATLQNWGAALQRAGFALPVVDVDNLKVDYRDPSKVFIDLKSMGETLMIARQGRPLRRDVLRAVIEDLSRQGGRISFDLVALTGWAPSPTQPKPLKPGSASRSLKDAIEGFKS